MNFNHPNFNVLKELLPEVVEVAGHWCPQTGPAEVEGPHDCRL